jgi:hypothetical protein
MPAELVALPPVDELLEALVVPPTPFVDEPAVPPVLVLGVPAEVLAVGVLVETVALDPVPPMPAESLNRSDSGAEEQWLRVKGSSTASANTPVRRR